MFLIGTDTFLVSPLLPTLSKLYQIPTSISGWMVSAYAIGYAVFALISGPLSDRYDRKKVMLAGLAAFAIATFLCGFANTFFLMILFRLLAGISASFITPQVWASIPTVVEKQHVVKVMGFATAGLAVSQLVGIPFGSFLAVVSWHLPFFVLSLGALGLFLLNFAALPSLQAHQAQKQNLTKMYREIWRNTLAKHYLVAYFLFQTGSFTAMTFISTWFTARFDFSLSSVGTAMIAIGGGNLLGALTGSWLIKRWSLERVFFGEFIALICLYGGLTFVSSFWLAELLLTLVFVVNGFIFPLFMATLQSTTQNARSTISSFSNAAMYLGETLAGISGGILFKVFAGYSGIALFTALMMLIALFIYQRTGIFKSDKKIRS